jgi:hypothetical protein
VTELLCIAVKAVQLALAGSARLTPAFPDVVAAVAFGLLDFAPVLVKVAVTRMVARGVADSASAVIGNGQGSLRRVRRPTTCPTRYSSGT